MSVRGECACVMQIVDGDRRGRGGDAGAMGGHKVRGDEGGGRGDRDGTGRQDGREVDYSVDKGGT